MTLGQFLNHYHIQCLNISFLVQPLFESATKSNIYGNRLLSMLIRHVESCDRREGEKYH